MIEREKPLRVAIQQSVIPNYSLALFEGIARQPGISLLVSHSLRAHALSNHQPAGVRTRAWPTHSFGRGSATLRWDEAQWQLAGSGACDVLVLEWNAWFVSLVPALLRARRHRIRTVLWGHGYSKRPSRLRDALRSLTARFADALLLYDSHTAQRYREAGWCTAEVYHAANSLDDRAIERAARPWRDNPARLQAFRQQHGLTAGSTLLFIGRLYRENDLDLLLQAFARVLARRPGCRLVVIGDDARELPRLKALGAALTAGDAIRWTGALYDENKVAPWALCADLFVYPSNVGLSLIHAFNYGLPAVVAGDPKHHNPEIHALRDGQNGVLLTKATPETYADAIIGLLADPARLAQFSANARATIEREFNMANMVRGFLQAIRPHA